MPEYEVTVPCTMSIIVTVDADNEEAAKKKAFELCLVPSVSADDDSTPAILEFEMHEHVTDGNVFNGVLNDIEVDEA